MSTLTKVSHLISNYSYRRRKTKCPKKIFSLRYLCEKAGLNTSEFDDSVINLLDSEVSYICRFSERFTKNCICFQLYNEDDNDNTMRKAIDSGALVCVTDHPINGLPCIVVDDTAEIYARMCAEYRNLSQSQATAVFGSIGKTTTKKMIYAVYKQKYKTWCDTGNDNILDSVGAISQHIPDDMQQVVFEFSEDTPGRISKMSKIANPYVCVVTDIDKSHIEYYLTEDRIREEFLSALQYLRDDGVCITNYDNINNRLLFNKKNVVFVSLENEDADYYADDIQIDEHGLLFLIHEKTTFKTYKVRLYNTFARHNVYSALMAFAAGVYIGMDKQSIILGLSKYRSSGFRQNIYKSKDTVIYADCYNAVAKSIKSAVNAADIIPIKGKRIAVIGDVAEAGNYTAKTHMEIVRIINNSHFDYFLTCGQELKKSISKMSFRSGLKVLTFDTQPQMNFELKKIVKNGDLVLFKSSHSGNLQRSIRYVFPKSYTIQMIKYYAPRIIWHFRVIMN